MADVSVYDGSKWVSIAGEDGVDGKSVSSILRARLLTCLTLMIILRVMLRLIWN